MPLYDTNNEMNPAQPNARFPLMPRAPDEPSPSALDVLAAAERTSNIVGQAVDRFTNFPKPSAPAQPGFNPIDHIPAGYLHEYGHRFLDAENPAQVQWIKQRIDSELQDHQILGRAGWPGVAATFAAGQTDPLTLASMALVPEAAATRIGNAMRWAMTNAAISAAQEGASQSLSETRTTGDSLLNIGGGAVLGGLLGSLARRVPRGAFNRMAEDIGTDLHRAPPGEQSVLGPEERRVADPQNIAGGPEAKTEFAGTRNPLVEYENAAMESPDFKAAYEKYDGAQKAGEAAAKINPRAQERFYRGTSENQAANPTGITFATPSREYAQAYGENVAEFRAPEGKGLDLRHLGDHGSPEKLHNALADALGDEAASRAAYHIPMIEGEQVQTHGLMRLPEFAAELRSAGYDHVRFVQDFNGKPTESIGYLEKPELVTPPEPEFHPLPGEPTYVNPNEGSTAGAAAVAQDIDDVTTGRGAQTLTKTIGKVTPGGRIMSQPSIAARKLLLELANVTGTMEQNYKGIANPNPIERILWSYDGLHAQGVADRREQFKTYLARVRNEGGDPLSRREFMDQVSYAMRRGDRSNIPEVAKAAAGTRAKIFQPLFERAKKLGLVPENAKLYADSYLTRQYDTVKIRKNLTDWIDLLKQGFMEQGVDPAEAADIAYAATRNVLGSERGTMDWHALDGIVPKSGQMKERTLTLPDHLLEPYLNNDIDHLAHSYLRSMAPEVEMTERFGTRDLKDQLDEVTDEYSRMMERARAVGDKAAMEQLSKQSQKTRRDLEAVRDRLYGLYGAPKDPAAFMVRAGRLARQVNAARLLGAATLSHLPDFANIMLRYGAPNTFAAMAKLATSLDAMKLSYAQAKRMGAALDMTMNMSASLLGDYGSHSRFAEQRIANQATRTFTIITGETPLITLTQAMTSVMAQDELIRSAEKVVAGKTLSSNLSAKLASAGIDESMLQRIAEQRAKYGRDINGLKFAMSDQWADQKAAQAFESAVIREAHGVTLRPGAADTPLFMSSELGKLILQFKSFAFAANRVVGTPLAQGLAHGDVRSAAALVALTSMGTLSYAAKQKMAGQPIETNPARLAGEVLDKSNLLGWTGEIIFPSLWLAGFRNMSRFSDRDISESVLGPTAGTGFDLLARQFPARFGLSKIAAKVDEENKDLPFRRSDLHFLRRMLPGQNLWYARRGVNATEDLIGDAFDLPGKSNEQRELMASNQ